MANEFKHKDPGSALTQAEFIASDGTGHIFDGQAAGDILYAFSTTVLKNLAKATDGNVLELASGLPAWTGSPNLTALAVDDVAIDGKVITMTGSSGDTAVFTVGTNGTLSLVTVDTAATAANIQITADGTVDIDSAGILTLDSGAAINIEPAAGSAVLIDGNVSIDGDAVTGIATLSASGVITAGGFTIGSAAITEAELEILDGATVTTTELNLLDALDRGSILYGNSSGVTAVLGQGGANEVLTSDGTDIAWAAGGGGATSWVGGDTSEATMTSTSAAELSAISSLTIGEAVPFFIQGNSRKTHSATADASLGLRLDSTIVDGPPNSGSGIMVFSGSAYAQDGVFEVEYGARDTGYLNVNKANMQANRTSNAARANGISPLSDALETAITPAGQIEDVDIMGMNGSSDPLNTLGLNHHHIYTRAVS